ncbi:unnamed protein product [Trifolium pratense]|uniref:Uncharacterized protein n=1 Tax=Trifolium pratense TaxID=57577 RepID=A0ACB0MFW3_TRIPR|nr:unnamed protein product [Trifolium pratense]
MAEVAVLEPVAIVSDPSQIEVKLFNRWSFDDVQLADMNYYKRAKQ